MTHEEIIAQRTGLKIVYVQNTIALLLEGATIPFISRYRKEATGGMTDVEVAEVSRQLEQLQEMDKRRSYILQAIEGQGKLTDELRQRIEECTDAITLEDIYLPFKQKRRTRAQVAREAGLEPLANILQAQKTANVTQTAGRYINKEKGIDNVQKALQGAQDIIAERVSESERARQSLRTTFARHAVIYSRLVKGKDIEGQNYR
ncbi:MAG: Tex-like N-terminal domain-containing protein, partial [Bacteroidaceae bacterium]|nr:Tex-like N-terminal domain-containing protein [Bacteroidaceae bacterium]